jgi:hypothetical protein
VRRKSPIPYLATLGWRRRISRTRSLQSRRRSSRPLLRSKGSLCQRISQCCAISSWRRIVERSFGTRARPSQRATGVFGNWGLFTDVVGDAKSHPEFEDLIADRFIIGSPEECAAQITELIQGTGCNRLVARIQWVGMEHRYVMRTIELLGNEVAPLVRKALA